MPDDKESELKLEPEIKRILDKISDDLGISFNKVLHASILHGVNRYWLPLQKYYSELKVQDQPIKEEDFQPLLSDLKEQIESSNTAIQKIDEPEEMFERRYPFGKFTDLHERQAEFIKFIKAFSKPKEITPKDKKYQYSQEYK